MYTIGKFSIITSLTVKTLRNYHDRGLLLADYVDEDTGYRYYKESSVERALVIKQLRAFEFSLSEIEDLLKNHEEDGDLLQALQTRQLQIRSQQAHYKKLQESLDLIIQHTQRNNSMDTHKGIAIKQVEDILFAGYKIQGVYSEIGRAFKKVGRKAGRHINGTPLGLFFDGEYREQDANFAGGFPVKKEITGEGIYTETLPGGPMLSVVYQGPYEGISAAYKNLFEYASEHKLELQWPSREVYHKGPGMIFKGNPEKYKTEIQIPVSGD